MKYHVWTVNDLWFLNSNYLTMTDNQIGDHLGISREQVMNKRELLGLKKKGIKKAVVTRTPPKGHPRDDVYARPKHKQGIAPDNSNLKAAVEVMKQWNGTYNDRRAKS